jgi:hypothetical protein
MVESESRNACILVRKDGMSPTFMTIYLVADGPFYSRYFALETPAFEFPFWFAESSVSLDPHYLVADKPVLFWCYIFPPFSSEFTSFQHTKTPSLHFYDSLSG